MVIVTQADRKRAEPFLEEEEWHPLEIECGNADSHWLIQELAAHRIAAIEE